MTPFWQARDLRVGASRTHATALIHHGHRDEFDREIALAGYFDQLPGDDPKHALIASWAHAYPDDVRGSTRWGRADWEAMKLAWLDRNVKGDTTAGVEDWPIVEVQDSEGQWRAEPDWPTASGPRRALALSADGELGTATPTGTSDLVEGAYTKGPAGKTGRGAEDGRLVFTTPPLDRPLHVTGQPALDLWGQRGSAALPRAGMHADLARYPPDLTSPPAVRLSVPAVPPAHRAVRADETPGGAGPTASDPRSRWRLRTRSA